MYYGLLALLTRSLRQDSRQLKNHLFRLVFVGFIYFSLLLATATSSMFGAPGLHFFKFIAWLNAIFITCAGIGFFSSAITEEKEEDVIGLLTMAGLNPLAILLGKSTSRLIQAALLLVVQFPFMLLAVTLGGVTPYQIFAAYVALLAFMMLLANVALVWSTCCDRTGTASALTCIILVIYTIAPLTAPLISAEFSNFGLSTTSTFGKPVYAFLELFTDTCVYFRIHRIMTTGFNDPILSRQVIFDSISGIVAFLVAWLIFIPCTNNSTPGGVSRGMVTRSSSSIRFLSAGRVWAMPLVWKDFHFIAGGYSFVIVKVLGCVGLLTALSFALGRSGVPSWHEVASLYLSSILVVFVVEVSVLAARIFHDEVRLQTLSALMMIPRDIPYLAYGKVLGCVLGLLPTIIAMIVGVLLLPNLSLDQALRFCVHPVVWGFVLVLVIFVHLVALLSLFVKWGALPLAIVLMVPFNTCCPVFQLLLAIVTSNNIQESAGSFAATVTIWILTGLFCFVFQMMIASRLQEVSSK